MSDAGDRPLHNQEGIRTRRDDAAARRRSMYSRVQLAGEAFGPFPNRRRRPSATRRSARSHVPAPRVAAERYRFYRAPATRLAAAGVAGPIPETELGKEFRMAQDVQDASRRPRARFRRLRRKPWFWPVIGVPAILMLVALIALAPVLYSAWQAYRTVTVEQVEHIESEFVAQVNLAGTPELVAAPTEMVTSDWNGDDPINILLLGADVSVDGASRTDTIIIVNINPRERTARMMSLPRDLKVVIPGYGVHKINAAFALGDFNQVQGGGAGLTIRTIEANLGIPIHAFVQVDFHGFIAMIDTVGGVTIDNPFPLQDNTYPGEAHTYRRIYFPAGWQHLNGNEALTYARTRHQDGDNGRSARQQRVLMALRDQAVSLDLINQLPTLITQFGDSLRTDIGLNDARRLAQIGIDIPRENISSMSVMPALYDDIGEDGTYYLSADWAAMGGILTEFWGTPVSPPGAVISNPDYNARVLILNGTPNEGLAGRVGTILEQNGFASVSVDTTENIGDYPKSTIIDRDGDLGTSFMITNLIGVGADTIAIGDTTPEGTSVAQQYGDYDIIITLGNDSPDPGNAEWTLDDYQQQASDDGALEQPSSQPAAPTDVEDSWTEEDELPAEAPSGTIWTDRIGSARPARSLIAA